MSSKKELQEKPQTAMVMAGNDYAEFADQGYENQDGTDLTIPFIAVLQALSKAVQKEGSDAKAGMLYNTVTEEVFKGSEGFLFVPAVTNHCFVEWRPRAAGGGFVGLHDLTSQVVADAKKEATDYKLKTKEGNDLVETYYVYGVVANESTKQVQMAVIPFTGTKIKVYKKWNTSISTFTLPTADGSRKIRPPMFANLVRVTSVKETSPNGDYFNFVLTPANGDVRGSLIAPTDDRFIAAKECRDLVNQGKARASYETQEQEDTSSQADKVF